MRKQIATARITTVSLLLLTTQLLAGCDNSELRQKVTEFQDSVNNAKSSVSTYYLGVNDLMRDLYVDSIRYKRPTETGKPIEELKEIQDAAGNKKYVSTGLVEYYSKDHIAIRLAAMEAISTYTYGLAELITSDSPQKAHEAIIKTGAELNALNDQLTAASGGRIQDVSKFTTPIANLSALVAQKWLEYSQRKATAESIKTSKDNIQSLCKELEEDVNSVNDAVAGPKASRILDSLKDEYNGSQTFVNGTPLAKDRNELLDRIKSCSKRKADISQCPTGPFLNRLRTLHDRLVDFVDDRKGITTKVKAILAPGDMIGPDLARDLELLKFESEALKQNTDRLKQTY